MALRYTIEKHVVAFPSKLIASDGGAHIYNIEINKDRDNGQLATKGDFVELDHYKEGTTAPTFTGVVLGKSARGYWYVEVKTVGTGDAAPLFLYNPEVIEETYNRQFTQEDNYYNAKGSVIAGYTLVPGDVFEISEGGFSQTPQAGKEITGYADDKYTVATA